MKVASQRKGFGFRPLIIGDQKDFKPNIKNNLGQTTNQLQALRTDRRGLYLNHPPNYFGDTDVKSPVTLNHIARTVLVLNTFLNVALPRPLLVSDCPGRACPDKATTRFSSP